MASDLLDDVIQLPWRALAPAGLLLLLIILWPRERWREMDLSVLALAWAGAQILLGIWPAYPPASAVDWLVWFSIAAMLVPLTALGGLNEVRRAQLCGVLLLVACGLMLHRLPFLLERGESVGARMLLMLASGAGLVVIAGSAAGVARVVPAAGYCAGMTVLAAALFAGLWRMDMPHTALQLQALPAVLAAAGWVAGMVALPHRATAPFCVWLAGLAALSFLHACVSRVPQAALWPCAALVAGLLATGTIVFLCRRMHIAGLSLVFVALMALTGTGAYWLCAKEQQRSEVIGPAVETGADDTGAYD